jgi:catechol 2,3-dioxygenase-like lactoylglutathione lyase family enzyme
MTFRTTKRGGVQRFAGFRRPTADLARAVDFYIGALGFAIDGESESDRATRSQRLALGDEKIELFAPSGFERAPGAGTAGESVADPHFQHIAIVTRDIEAALHRLLRFSPRPISRGGAVLLPPDAGGVTACKFRDPDDHPLELIQFPPGAGDPVWRRTDPAAPTGPNLGFDHSAIGVRDIARSLSFYVDGLGFDLSSRHLNSGIEQARLDGVVESVVDVVGLAPNDRPTPHLELLGYRVPAPTPVAAPRVPAPLLEMTDEMIFVVDDLGAVAVRLEAIRPGSAGSRRVRNGAMTLRDDDGHTLRLLQATG